MSKTFLYKLFKIGQIPKNYLSQIQCEGVVLKDEGIGGSITYRNFRASGRYHGWKRSWFTGSIVLTREHFLAFKYSETIIGLAWNESHINELNCYLDNENTLAVQFDASAFNKDCSGQITVRFSTPLAREILENIQRLISV
ncbi:MAG: hypothetical protein AB4041_20255 [Microcystaceae cyanobacterium]